MKFSQIPEGFKANVRAYIDERAMLARDALRQSVNRVLGYIFTLNAGGLVGAATYAAAGKPINCLIQLAIIIWGLGLLASVIRATLDDYGSQWSHDRFFGDLNRFYSDELEWDQLVANGKRGCPQWPFHTLGIASGVFFFLGLILGFCGVIG